MQCMFYMRSFFFGLVYNVNCERGVADQENHCDRLRKAKPQIVTRWYLSNDPERVLDELSSEKDDNIHDEEPETENAGNHKRVRKIPFWSKDYVLSTCRSAMLNLKQTPRKQAETFSLDNDEVLKQLNALSVKVHSMLEVTMLIMSCCVLHTE